MVQIPFLSQLPPQGQTAVLLILLVLAFVIAFKVMKMVFETITVTVLSGAFYLALTQLFSFSFSFNQMLTYAFLGAGLYMVYSLLASAYGITRTVIEIPYKLLLLIFRPVKSIFQKAVEEIKLRKMKSEKETSEEESGSDTKEVILDKVKNQDEED